MNAKPTGAARRNSLDNDCMPAVYPRHEQLDNAFKAQAAQQNLYRVAPSISSSRTVSPDRWDKGASDDDDEEPQGSTIVSEMLDQVLGKNSEESQVFYDASRTAPITKQSLSELDIGSIINNSKLRHDVNFDRELHFRPNMDGERGRRKRDAQDLYWRAIAVELKLIFHVLRAPLEDIDKPALIEQCSLRLLQMFETIKEILKNLVPDRDQSDVDDHLDTAMLMQEISRGVCNFVSIASWMAQLLKRHCAPMRDEMVDRIVEKIEQETPDSITAGLADLFNVLEAMKLDVANHQIRHLRSLLIGDTINFERKYHISRMKKHRYDCKAARRWYMSIRAGKEFVRIPMTQSYPNKDVEAFVKGFLRLLLPTAARLPDTFTLDNDRIRVLRAEIDETIRESICCDVLKELMTRRGSTLSPDLQLAFQHRLQIIVRDLGMSQWHMHAIDDIACEIVRFALQSSGSSGGTDAELEDAASGMLHSQLKALGRARTAQDLDFVDTKDRKRIDEYGQDLFNQLFPRVFDCVEDFLSSSPYNIFLALVPPPAPPALSPTLPTMRPMERQQDLVRRIAHIVILHWRTWEHLVYNNEDLDRNTEGSNTEYSSRASTPGPEKPMKLQLTVQAVPEIPAPWAEVDKSGEGCATNKVPG